MLNKHIGSYKSPHSILGHESHLFEIAPSVSTIFLGKSLLLCPVSTSDIF